ncbi:glutamine synthetase [Marinobacter salinisoli]|uniref:Glutamine synthetase n=1 Tax=Marinobacter salinisoli TaxID=2769486 RepID=A0ABX7MRS5_9GAMM|nr:glutamine synthetase family protein [Marinobacter salinisoli]QSP95008.1 glutamine synthetase [Marinobacter salinisoli]
MTENEVSAFLKRYPKVTTIELLISDLNGVLRGKRIERNLLEKVVTQGFYLPGSVMSLDATGTTVESAGLGVDVGDRDQRCRLIPETLAIVPWIEDGSRAQALCTMVDDNDEPFFSDPRQILCNALERFNKLNYQVGFAAELEFYLVDMDRDAQGGLRPPASSTTGRRMGSCQVYSIDDLNEYDAFIQDVLQAARAQNIPADTVIAEYAPGQFEVNLHHSDNIVRSVDHAILLKRVIRHVARKHGMEATFMAKPYIEESGNGLHMHLSLMQDGKNVLAADNPVDNPIMRNMVAGLLSMADSTQAFMAPNINSYRRLAPGAFAPTAKNWGYDNRTVALRIPSGSKAATRIEHRMAGADANPYLVATAVIAGVTEGIQHRMEPSAPVTGNAYDQEHPHVADNLRDALRNMKKDVRVADWFGESFVKVYQACKWHDLHLFEQQITQLEYDLLLGYA